MIIVIVPMVAVALVLFSITADSETGKADAEIAQGLRAAFAVYDSAPAAARAPLDPIAGDAELGRLLAHPGHRGAIERRLKALARTRPTVESIVVYDQHKRPLARAGARD